MLFFLIKYGLIIAALAYIGKKVYPYCVRAYEYVKAVVLKIKGMFSKGM